MKSTRLICAILAIGLVSCKTEKITPLSQQDFSLTCEFYPSFIKHCRIILQKKGEVEKISIQTLSSLGDIQESKRANLVIENINNSLLDKESCKIHKRMLGDSLIVEKLESVKVTHENFRQFVDSLSNIDFSEQSSLHKSNINDGITIYFRFTTAGVDNRFSFRCPNKSDSTEYKIIKTILELIEKSFKNTSTHNYIENLKGYFDFGLLVKHISDKPLEYRFYGALSSNEETEFYTFMKSLPTKKTIIFDMSNFEGMGTMYYPNFKELIVRNSNVYWIVNEQAQEQAQEIGVKADKIFTNRQILMTKLKNEP